MSGAVTGIFSVVTFGLAGLLLDSMMPKPPTLRLGDINRQTAKEGDPRTIVWGIVRPIGGNLNHCQEPQKRMVKQSTSGGKGGSKKKEQKVERVYRTYSISVCEGPITAFRRIWRNGKLAYDGRGTAWGIKNNPVFLRKFRLYTGAWSQMPDPALEAIWGAGMVPAYRGTAYMVCLDEDLTELGGAVAQWQFEVERAEGVYLTSRPYSVESVESINIDQSIIDSGMLSEQKFFGGQEAIDIVSARITGGELRSQLISYSNYPPEGLNMGVAQVNGGTLTSVLIEYNDYPPEGLNMGGASINGGILEQKLIIYNAYPSEAVSMSGALIGGGSLS